jgi:hypothetical protein
MDRKKRDKHPNEKPETKAKGEAPTNQWAEIVRGTGRRLSASGWVPNFVIGAVLLLIGPLVGIVIKNPKVAIVSCALGVTFLVWTVAVVAIQQVSKGPVEETATHGLLIPANDPDPPNPCPQIPPNALKLFLGSSAAWTTSGRMTVLQIAEEPIISIRQIGSELAVSAKVYSDDGRIVAELVDNEFHVNPNNYFRTERKDRHSLLVYDQRSQLVLNVRFLNPSTVRVTGIFNYPRREPLVVADEYVMLPGRNRFLRACFGGSGTAIHVT